MKILKLHTDWTKSEERKKTNGYGGCGYYRTIKPAEYLRPEYDIDAWGKEWQEFYEEMGENNANFYFHIFHEYDIVWLHYIDNGKMLAWLFALAQKFNKKVVIDIDDNFLDLDEENPAKRQYDNNKMIKTNLAVGLSFADAITVSTLPLKERVAKHIKEVHGVGVPIFVVPNYNDINDWNFKPVEKTDGVVIGYMGSVSHQGDIKIVLPAIRTILEKYPKAVFQIMGQWTLKDAKKNIGHWPKEIRKRVYAVQPTVNQKDFPLWFSQQPWDIGIAPLMDTPFNRCKSHIKWMEYAMYKIPTVASKVYPYYVDVLGKETIKDGETGILANDNEWVEKLSTLIENKELREKIGQNAYESVKNNWQYKDVKNHLIEVVENIKKLKKNMV